MGVLLLMLKMKRAILPPPGFRAGLPVPVRSMSLNCRGHGLLQSEGLLADRAKRLMPEAGCGNLWLRKPQRSQCSFCKEFNLRFREYCC